MQKKHGMFKIKSCFLLKSNVIKGKYFNRELHYLVNRSTDVGRGNVAVPFSFVDSVLHMNHNAIYSSALRSLLRAKVKVDCSENMIDWQYLLLGYLKQYIFSIKENLEVVLSLN